MDGDFLRFLRIFTAACFLTAMFLFGGILADKLYLRQNAVLVSVSADANILSDKKLMKEIKKAVSSGFAQNDNVEQNDDIEKKLYSLMEENDGISLSSDIKVEIDVKSTDPLDLEEGCLPAGCYRWVDIYVSESACKRFVVFPDEQTDYVKDFVFYNTIAQKKGYQHRFQLLNALGWLERKI